MEKFAIKQNGQVNQRLIFKTEEEAIQKANTDDVVVPVWEFFLWFRQYDEKDFIEFYSDKADIEEAVEEAIGKLSRAFSVDNPTFGVVAKYGGMTNEFKIKLQNQSQC